MLEKKEDYLRNLTYQPRQPVDVVFNTIDDLVEYTQMARTTFSQLQTIGKAYYIFNRSRLFDRAITEWNRKPNVQKTWANLKAHFRTAQRELRESTGSTIAQYQLHETANLVQQVVDGIQQVLLPDDAGPDPTTEILQQVMKSASASSTTQQQLATQIQQLQQMMATMKMQMNAHQHNTTTPIVDPNVDGGRVRGGGTFGRGRGGQGDQALRYPLRYNFYCWTHGGCGHLGSRCRNKAPGHNDDVTFGNKMSGSKVNCPEGNVAPAPAWVPPNANA